ncbi:MAG: aminoacetone oxidase family FAD-binding enzyme [Clostridia bacterium]|nr:aminoacetone oxidase family FAD-binding enzyme [Clostridia bacterium]
MEKYTDIAIIGGGASGLAAAVSAKDAQNARVEILEKYPRTGKKLLATGNGRCNLWNANASEDKFFGAGAFAKHALEAFDKDDFFASVGLEIRVQDNGLAYPMSNQASAVLDCLRFTCAEKGVSETTDFHVVKIEGKKGKFRITSENGDIVFAKRVVLATGSMAQPKLGGNNAFQTLLKPFGHSFTRCLPALSYLKTNPSDVSGLKGMKYQGEIALLLEGRQIACETGEILFSENGVSGIAAMQLSLYAAEPLSRGKKLCVRMSPLPMKKTDAEAFIGKRKSLFPERTLEELLTGAVVKRIAQAAFKRAGVSPLTRKAETLTRSEIRKIAGELTEWLCPVVAVGGFDVCQVMLGGAEASEFDEKTMESKLVPGLYAAGELMDVTGPCGGYNLTWAWASGALAGRSASDSL